eukprot:CAMPEP_0202465812 /NCGR_PEP_ID=MMETSP1360-20130828/66809_1 /ASSEMBLY_ACC=CAM_ASM_000848 /TAXON_ID=515479 /ORGANISM="Licmophora paradoxa, Strain CCMP2313" /LENGTH=142 /DNA_ID=CAMNT_0049089721 /DNA_START=815 /DNA_END=1240 /DNA_ORIENTATION=+
MLLEKSAIAHDENSIPSNLSIATPSTETASMVSNSASDLSGQVPVKKRVLVDMDSIRNSSGERKQENYDQGAKIKKHSGPSTKRSSRAPLKKRPVRRHVPASAASPSDTPQRKRQISTPILREMVAQLKPRSSAETARHCSC